MPEYRRPYRVRDLMSSPVVTLTQGQSLPAARDLMAFHRLRHLPVVDADGTPVGLVTHRDLLAGALSSLTPLDRDERDELQLRVPVARVMRTRFWTIHPDAPAESAARLMLDHQIGCLPVVETGALVGIITEADFVEVAAESLPVLRRSASTPPLALSALWTPSPQVIEASQSIVTAREVMSTLDVRHLPVTIASELFGLLSERELALAEALAGPRGERVLVGQLVTKPAFVVNPDARPEEVAIDMANAKHGAALAVRAGQVLGIITTTDLARALGLALRERRAASGRPPHPELA
jgi:CBS domain-containing membrane protein